MSYVGSWRYAPDVAEVGERKPKAQVDSGWRQALWGDTMRKVIDFLDRLLGGNPQGTRQEQITGAHLDHLDSSLEMARAHAEGEAISERTKRKKVDTKLKTEKRSFDANMVGTFAGVIQDLSKYLASGFLGRVCTTIVSHSVEDQDFVGEKITDAIGTTDRQKTNFTDVKNHYTQLIAIQKGTHPIYPPIVSVIIPDKLKKIITKQWNATRANMDSGEDVVWYRELYDAYRIACASALLHVNEREIKTKVVGEEKKEVGAIVLEKNDAILGWQLACESMKRKWSIMNMDEVRSELIKLGKLNKNKGWTAEQLTNEYYDQFGDVFGEEED